MGGLPVLRVGGAAQDPHRDADHHLQQDTGQPQQHVEICQTLPDHTGKYITALF